MGPIRIESLRGKIYIFVMVDEFSRFGWVKFIKENSNTFEAFKSLCITLHNKKEGNSAKVVGLKSDRGKEFENSDFSEFCSSNGINHEFSTPRTPQHNGVC